MNTTTPSGKLTPLRVVHINSSELTVRCKIIYKDENGIEWEQSCIAVRDGMRPHVSTEMPSFDNWVSSVTGIFQRAFIKLPYAQVPGKS